MIDSTIPAPTVRPPSRIANLIPLFKYVFIFLEDNGKFILFYLFILEFIFLYFVFKSQFYCYWLN
jgi:hypothetical protein